MGDYLSRLLSPTIFRAGWRIFAGKSHAGGDIQPHLFFFFPALCPFLYRSDLLIFFLQQPPQPQVPANDALIPFRGAQYG